MARRLVEAGERVAPEEPALFYADGWDWRWWSWREWRRHNDEGDEGDEARLTLPGGPSRGIDWELAARDARSPFPPESRVVAGTGSVSSWLGASNREVIVELEPQVSQLRAALLTWAIRRRAAIVLTSREQWVSTVLFARPTVLWGELELLDRLESALRRVRGQRRRRRRVGRLRGFHLLESADGEVGSLLRGLGVPIWGPGES